jgi:hypothetical protein
MYAEHCTKLGCDIEFETSNYHIKTTARREWAVVVDKDPLTSTEDGHARRVPDIEELKVLPMTVKAKILHIEIIALVLYTGPMVSWF